MRLMKNGWYLIVLLSFVLATAAYGASLRPTVSLDGEWDFATDPEGVGEAQKWYLPEVDLLKMPLPGYAPEADGTIQVPGIWDSQGYGTETQTVHHNAPGKGWYRRSIQIPAGWRGKRVFVCFGGIHRYAKVWVNGHYLGEHIGYLSAFEYDVTDLVKLGSSAFITVQVDSKQRCEVDSMYGTADLADFMTTEWGGIWDHVTLEARAGVWLSELCIRPDVAESRCTASAVLNGAASGANGVRLEVFDGDGQRVAEATKPLQSAIEISASIPDPTLWSPDTPYVYRARLSLLRDGKAIDAVEDGFGMREITIDGYHILLNGKRFMLCGYGDDHIYPKEMALSVDKAMHLKRLRLIKSYGFNHVRHHSAMMPDEYYEACDEVGIMPNAEFPIAYRHYIPGTGSIWRSRVPEGTDPGPALETYLREWAAAIKRHRNHPSIFCWVMGNEMYDGRPFGPDFKATANQLDPTRPFVDTDGVFHRIFKPENDRDTLDLYFFQFDVGNNPIDKPKKFVTPKPRKPVIAHEMGNYVTFSRPEVADAFVHNVKPYWLTPAVKRLEELGYRDEADLWAEKSERMYMLCHKLNIEAMRKNSYISGHHWWLFQDYWSSSNGIVDFYFRPKDGITAEEVRKIVSDVVLLQGGFAATYRGKQSIAATVSVSNFSLAPFTKAEAAVRVTLGGKVIKETKIPVSALEQGAVSKLGDVALQLPDVSKPAELALEATLNLNGKTYTNDWSARVYPAIIPAPDLGLPIYATRAQLPYCEAFGAKPIPKDETLSARAIYVVGAFDERIVDAVEKGASLLLLGDGCGMLPTWAGKFRTSWWKAGHGLPFDHFPVNYGRNNCGNLVYEHPVTRAMAPEGWCDADWHPLIQDGFQFVVEDAPAKPEIIVRALPGLSAVQDKAMLFEVCMGKGRLMVSGFNHEKAQDTPTHAWLMARMLEHAARGKRPDSSWPISLLRDRALPPGAYLSGFRSLNSTEYEDGNTRGFRGNTTRHYILRQKEAGKKLAWTGGSMPADLGTDKAVFVFAGGLGWRSEPKTDGFRLWVNGEPKVVFDVPEEASRWSSTDGTVSLRYESKWKNNEDNAGLFYVEIARASLTPEKPVQFEVESLGSGSKRWFALAPYADLGM